MDTLLTSVKITNSDIIHAAKIIDKEININIKQFLDNIIDNPWGSFIIKKFEYLHILNIILPHVALLKVVPQQKRQHNALLHTIKVLNYVEVLYPNNAKDSKIMKYAALFHDVGKYDTWIQSNNFYGHEKISADIFASYCSLYELLDIKDMHKVKKIIRAHMLPFSYQRNEWNDDTIFKFVRTFRNCWYNIIDLSICDKRANTSNEDYIKPLYKLRKLCLEVEGEL